MLQMEHMFLQHWFIMFTVSCFANLLGLNISSAFNSAVTIYILIPLLIIPQLILSGVVVKFDKLNPVIGNTATVPFVGDLMASRWAFEASMVAQFKDNRFEKEFYLYDKVMAEADYVKVYFVPELETRLQFCLSKFQLKDDVTQAKLQSNLTLIRREISNQLEESGEKLRALEKLNVTLFDSAAYTEITAYLENLKEHYVARYNKADKQKEKKIFDMTKTPEEEKAYEEFRLANHNEAITELVKNISETHRIIEKDGKLIQKIYPIYKDPDPDHAIDFDAQFYMPAKHFLNRNIDTFYFNTGVIWSMTFVFAVALYFDVLRRIIDGAESLSKPIKRK
jgi:hypothetical protein